MEGFSSSFNESEIYFNKLSQNDCNIKVTKNNISFLIPPTNITIQNWYKNNYEKWEEDTFNIINKFINKDKILFDIGSWVGLISIPYSRYFSKVIAVEADNEAVVSLHDIISINNINNIEIINKAVFEESNKKVYFGQSNFRLDLPGLNQSTSHIKYDIIKQDDYSIDTISLYDVVQPYISDIGLIKIDIEGGEGFLLDDISKLLQINIPIFISFHYPWIKNKDKLLSFSNFISNHNIKYYDSDYNLILTSVYDYIIENNFGSILLSGIKIII